MDLWKGAAWVASLRFASLFLSFVTTVALARILDAQMYGVFATMLSVASIFVTFSSLGLNASATYFISKSLGKKDGKDRAIFSSLLQLKIFFVLFILVLYLALSPIIADALHLSSFFYIFLFFSLFWMLFNSFQTFLSQSLAGYFRFKEMALSQFSSYFSKFFLAPTLAIIFSVFGAALGYVLSAIIGLIVCFYYIRDKITRERFLPKGVWAYGFNFGLSQLALSIIGWADLLMIGFFLGPLFVGYYRIAIISITSASSLFMFLGTILFPFFTKIGQKGGIKKYFPRIFYFTSFIAFFSFIVSLVVSKQLICLIFGKQYLPSLHPFVLLTPILFIAITMQVIFSAISGMGKVKTAAKVNGLSAAVNVILNGLLIPLFGIVGAAVASVVSRAIVLVLLAMVLSRMGYQGNFPKTVFLSLLLLPLFLLPPSWAFLILIILSSAGLFLLMGGLDKEIRKELMAGLFKITKGS